MYYIYISIIFCNIYPLGREIFFKNNWVFSIYTYHFEMQVNKAENT